MDGRMPEDMWTPYKHLYEVCQFSIRNPSEVSTEFELCLKKHKQNFTNFLRNPPKSEKSRAHLRNALREGVILSGQTRKVELSQDIIDEAIILSDMFDLDEIFSLELLCTAQRQQVHHPGLPRGLVAVLLYYDGRKAISCTLRDMFQAISGVSWCAELPREMTALINNYCQCLVEDSNLLGRVLEILHEMDLEKEVTLLTKNRAFGSKRHQNQVIGLYESTRKALAMALFNWSAQRGLPKHIAIRLLQHLANTKYTDAEGHMDDVTLIMLMALMYAYDTSVLLLIDCDNPHTARLPILSDPEFAQCFYEAIYAQTNWQIPHLDALVKYSFGLTLASLRQAPSEYQANVGAFINRDEQLIDEALAANIFTFFYRQLLGKNVVYSTEFIYHRLHLLITDFIDFMHAKVSELRGRADETARTVISFQNEGLEPPPNLDVSFEMLMLCVAKLYGDKRATITLCNEYWGPTDANSAKRVSTHVKNTSRAVSLFKFIRLASELLPQTLFRSYLKMIAGLTRTEYAARCAFNLLKNSQNLSSTYAVSWDHFFNALNNYFNNMRTDLDSISKLGHTIYRSRGTSRNMMPRETEHMAAVLGVMQAVAEHDEISRIMLCEHANWQTPQVLLGLVACATPVALKGEILFTLAALGRSKETARTIWFHLEESQIIPTLPSMSTSYPEFSLAEEIDQNESRLETYKLSRGVLKLLYTLMTTYMPCSLGCGPRKPGYDPYLKFVIDSILLKFYNRGYKDATEKWAVGAQCLKLLYFLLASYQPKSSDFLEERDEHVYPGYHIMLHLQVKSEMLRLVLRIIEEAREHLEDYNQFNGKELLEECALYALLMLEVALSKQHAFFAAHATANCSILLLGLNRMLLDLNPRTRNPDYVLNIIKFVSFNSWLERHTLAAIKILSVVSLLPDVASQILYMYAHGSNEKLEIRQSFVECLEIQSGQRLMNDEGNDQFTDIDEIGNKHNDRHKDFRVDIETLNLSQPPRIDLQIKEAIIRLFEANLNQPLPNFIYFLLGINVVRDFLSNEKQQLGLDVQYSCMSALVLLLERFLEQQRHNDDYSDHMAHIVERIYHLFHGLCANRRTSEAILRYFRLTCNDFLLRHLTAMPFRHHDKDNMMHAMSHVMNCVSIEMKVAATHGQTTRYALLADILLAVRSEVQRNRHNLPLEMVISLLPPLTSNNSSDTLPGRTMLQTTPIGLQVIRLLDCVTIETEMLQLPRLDFFDERLLGSLLTDCEGKGSKGAPGMINIHRLYDILHNELGHMQSAIASGQRKSILEEITVVLQYAIKLNGVRMQRFATYSYMSAWCNLVQVLFSLMPETVLPISMRKQHIIDIIEKIMMKVEPRQPLIKISIQVTDTMLLLSANLRHCYYQLEDQRLLDEHGNLVCLNDVPNFDASQKVVNPVGSSSTSSVNNTNADPNTINNNSLNNSNAIMNINNSSILITHTSTTSRSNLRFILKRLIEWIMTSEVKSQKLSINLYASLLNFLRIVKRVRSEAQVEYNETVLAQANGNRSESTLEFNSDELYQKEMAAQIISSMGEKLIDTICHDAITGHDICSMLALSCLNLISELRAFSTLSETIATRGYLRHILNSLSKSDESLRDILKPVPQTLRPLFVYESCIAFLTQMAQTHQGATLLLGEGVLGILSDMTIYDMQPDIKSTELAPNEPENFIPDIDTRFRSILMPALSLCDSIIDSLGISNNSASLQVLNFLFSHIEMIEGMLRAASPFMSLGYLKVLATVTNLFARTTTYNVSTIDNSLKIHNDVSMNSHVNRLQQLMILVFGRFTINEATIRRMLHQERTQTDLPDLSEEQKRQHVKYFLDITAHLSLFLRHTVTSHARNGFTSKYMITTMINDVTPLSGKSDCKKLTAVMQTIVNQLKGSIAYFLSQKSIADNLVQQRASLPNITFGPSGKQNYLELSQRHNEKHNELLLAVFIAEQNLYLLWIHLDFYLRQSVIFSQENRSSINESTLDPKNMSVLNASHEEITQIKQMIISSFNETFCTQLITASEEYSLKCKNFNTALLRRIKSLVQYAHQGWK